MKNRKIEKALKNAVECAPALPFSEIAAMSFIKMSEHDYITAQTEKKSPVRIQQFALAAAFCLLLLIPVSGWYQRNIAVDSIVMIDVNPSVEILTNSKDQVIAVRALNDDARKIIGDNTHKDKDITKTMDQLMDSLLEHNYLGPTTDTILLSVKNKDSKKADSLMAKIDQSIREKLAGQSIVPTILRQIISGDKDESKQATKYSISEGKLNLIRHMISADHDLTADSLSKMSIEQLLLLAKEKGIDLSGILSEGTREPETTGESKDQEDTYDNESKEQDEEEADDTENDDAENDDSENDDSDKEASDEEDSDEQDSKSGDYEDDRDGRGKGSNSDREDNNSEDTKENEEEASDDSHASYDNSGTDDTEDDNATGIENHTGDTEDKDNADDSDIENDEDYAEDVNEEVEASGDESAGYETTEDRDVDDNSEEDDNSIDSYGDDSSDSDNNFYE